MAEVKDGSNVKFHYTGKLESGETFDSSEGGDPLEFTVGEGMIIPGLEREIVGMKKGDKKKVKVTPKDAYGDRKEDLIREIPKGPIPAGMELKEGQVIYLKTKEGYPFPATIKEIKDESVVLDMNHPLAGKTLLFEVEIVEVA